MICSLSVIKSNPFHFLDNQNKFEPFDLFETFGSSFRVSIKILICDFLSLPPHSRVPAFLNVVDIAGLVKGASEGQGKLFPVRSINAESASLTPLRRSQCLSITCHYQVT